ncbi:dynamin family protein [Fodinicola feengrottensis]|uniref:dynamin family protein n=1 Tax=Fodinicola feengrottensis TaxID=435914 RepID=UPI0013D65602|nr:dynamin family protein [Fodinicola feengrottensis]
MSQPAVQTGKPAGRPDPQQAEAALIKVVGAAVDNGLAHIRRVDPDAASDIDAVRRRDEGRPVVVIVGETKRGKSSLVNALIGAPNLSPVDAAVATSAYLEFKHGQTPSARAYVPGDEMPVPLDIASLRDWGTVLGQLPDGVRPPRRIEITYPAPMLEFVDIVDTPGVGGLDSAHAEIALDAVEHATALLFVVDASAPFSQPELNFLSDASKRVNLVLFALTKTDIYPGWRTVMDDDIKLLQAHAPRFGQAGFFPVSSALAEVAATLPPEAAGALLEESRIDLLRKALSDGVAARGELLKRANVLRTVRSELIRLDQVAGDKIRTADPDPATLAELKEERGRVGAKKRTDTRSWQVSMSSEIKRSRTDITARVRTEVSGLQDHWMNAIDKAGAAQIKQLPYDVDRSLHALALRMTADMQPVPGGRRRPDPQPGVHPAGDPAGAQPAQFPTAGPDQHQTAKVEGQPGQRAAGPVQRHVERRHWQVRGPGRHGVGRWRHRVAGDDRPGHRQRRVHALPPKGVREPSGGQGLAAGGAG